MNIDVDFRSLAVISKTQFPAKYMQLTLIQWGPMRQLGTRGQVKVNFDTVGILQWGWWMVNARLFQKARLA